MKWTTACPDWEKRIVEGRSLLPNPLFPDTAVEIMKVFDKLRIVDVVGSPEAGEVTLDWLRDFVMCVFGAYDQESGERLITEFFMLISKKNTKSTIAALIMLTLLVVNWRHDAELLIIAPTKEVANNCFGPAAAAVRADEELSEVLHVQDHIRTITHLGTNAKLKVVAAEANTVSGTKASIILVEELWLFGKQVNAENMLREATGGLVSRPEGCVIYLTTQSDEPPAGVFKQKLEYARDVRDGIIEDPRFLPLIYEFPRELIERKAYLDPDYFYITNPNLGASVNRNYLERELKKAQTDEGTLRGFLAKHLNVEIGMNLRGDRWPGADFWEGGKYSEPVTIDTLIDQCEVITVGIDGGGLDDLLGAAAIGRTKKEYDITVPAHYDKELGRVVPETTIRRKKWLLWNYAWGQPSVLTRRQEIASKLRDIERAGEMSLVDYVGQDVDELADVMQRLEESGLLFQCGLDPASVGGILDAILLKGVPEDKMVTVNQGWRLAGSIKATERRLAEGVLVHGGTSLMNWCVGNARVKVTGNAIVITKQVSGTAKIDPLMATFNAVALMALNPPSQYGTYNFDNMVIGG